MKKHIGSYHYHSTEVAALLKRLHKEHGQTAGLEISIRYGKDSLSVNKDRVTQVVHVFQTDSESLYKGTHVDMYNQEVVDA